MGKKIGLVRRAGEEKRMDSNNIHLRIKVPLYGILQIDVCLRIQNLKKIENWFTNKGTRAISVRGVFNKNIVNFS